MINQSLSSTENSRKRNVRCSQPSSSGIEKHVRYSRHLSFQHQRTSSNGRFRLVIHTTIRSPKNNRRQIENTSAVSNTDLQAHHRQDTANNLNVIPNSAPEMQRASRSLSVDKNYPRHHSLPKVINDLSSLFHI
jgi:hypothetical protein